MPRATIDYMNARRALKPASGGARQSRAVTYAPDRDRDSGELAYEAAMTHIMNFSLWAETSRQALVQRLGISQPDDMSIPF